MVALVQPADMTRTLLMLSTIDNYLTKEINLEPFEVGYYEGKLRIRGFLIVCKVHI